MKATETIIYEWLCQVSAANIKCSKHAGLRLPINLYSALWLTGGLSHQRRGNDICCWTL